MLLKFIFKQLAPGRQAKFMTERGILVGTRLEDGRRIYLYMVQNLFAEITYENDNPTGKVETVMVIDGMKNRTYPAKDLRSML